jgi:hypothetical protein
VPSGALVAAQKAFGAAMRVFSNAALIFAAAQTSVTHHSKKRKRKLFQKHVLSVAKL